MFETEGASRRERPVVRWKDRVKGYMQERGHKESVNEVDVVHT